MTNSLPQSPSSNDKDKCAGCRETHLDMVRMACVLVWVSRHGEPLFHTSNIILNQNWSAPFLWLICGICWGRSRTSVWAYMARLVLVFFVGVCMNACAWKINNPGTPVDIFGVVFQMWFVVGLMAMIFMTSALKISPEASIEEKVVALLCAIAPSVLGACVCVILQFNAVAPEDLGIHSAGLHWWLQGNNFSVCTPALEFAMAQIIAACGCVFDTGGRTCWIMLVWILVTITYYQHTKIGMEFAAMSIFNLGFVVQRLGVYGRIIVGDFMAGYWPLILLVCGWLAIPFVHGVSDLEPSENIGTRARWIVITTILLAAFICAGDKIKDPFKIFTHFPGLNYWVLFLYVSHIAVQQTMPSPRCWWFYACSIVPFLLIKNKANPDEMKPVLASSKQAADV